MLDAIREQREAADALLLGRVTFEDMRGYWPLQTDDQTGIADYLDNVNKYVVSRTLGEPSWAHTTVLQGPVVDEVQALKTAPGADIVITGSVTLTSELIAAGLVDEYRLFVYPVVLGRGRRLFTNATGVPGLHLEEARPFRSGIVLLRYRTATAEMYSSEAPATTTRRQIPRSTGRSPLSAEQSRRVSAVAAADVSPLTLCTTIPAPAVKACAINFRVDELAQPIESAPPTSAGSVRKRSGNRTCSASSFGASFRTMYG